MKPGLLHKNLLLSSFIFFANWMTYPKLPRPNHAPNPHVDGGLWLLP